MTKEKSIDTSKQENQPQDKFADERLSEEQLDKIAGGNILGINNRRPGNFLGINGRSSGTSGK